AAEPLPARAVAAAAVRGVQALALRDVRDDALRRCRGLRGSGEQQHEDEEHALHDWWQGRSWTVATPSRTTITKKRTFPSSAACAKKWMRPSGPGSSLSTVRVSRKVTSAASHAATTTMPTRTASTVWRTDASSPHCTPATWHVASLM